MRNNSVKLSELGQWFRRRCHLKDFLSGALAALLFSGAEPFILKECIMGNIRMKLYEIRTSGSGGGVV